MVKLINKATELVTAVVKPQARKYAVAVVGVVGVLVSASILDAEVAASVVAFLTAVGVYQVENK